MQSVDSSARRARCQHRQELRTLTYVTLDAGNGGIVRNVNSRGVAVQAVAALREKQRVRLRFELQFPRLRLDVFGEVSWANASGQCGIRFVDLPAQTRLQIDRWIFSNLLEAMTLAAPDPESAFAGGFGGDRDIPHEAATNRGKEIFKNVLAENGAMEGQGRETLVRRLQEREMISDEERGWFSRPMAAPTLGFVADGLVLVSGWLIFALTFLTITEDLPPWPWTLAGSLAAAGFVAGTYWCVCKVFAGSSLGARLARAVKE
jgi:hypothetical protein